jgi:hypothetical protein
VFKDDGYEVLVSEAAMICEMFVVVVKGRKERIIMC